ncbi:MAG TPA: transporter [Flavobacteriales bacterium]|nr:transporter [Flavobacteriales bacterium]HRE73571.1 YeeE/YedE thiosulfate transporter family protein [Flavobacteriales bacterium]HRE97156.1 YeeE/YedE thiosulfate transporter family protein [Flavobacteriales bacterium]HRJ35011.1 YeeE/YedE thiosulfate transporter family protein [Flavobacteriales bacterium]HRJ37296.1 YeeE/YedE thiosulfate transporter family protein [Flavobacteriales bacterium]
MKKNLFFLVIGVVFGTILTKGEVISWFRIQEMFHFQSFHMYGVIGCAVVVGALSVQLIQRFNIKTIHGERINLEKKPAQYKAHILGGTLFGMGWALTGACPAPIYALTGAGYYPMITVLFSAVMGTFTYALVKDKLPH